MEKLSTFHKGQILTEGLILVREDICDWINKLFHSTIITGDSFLPSMHNGILLCDLIQKIYSHISSSSSFPIRWPKYPPQPDRKATPGSFKAKDNITLFLNWCRSIGLSNTILFETKGLVNSDEEKNVVLTLLHIGEVCVDFDIPVPEFAKFNKEMMIGKSKMTTSVYALEDSVDSVLPAGKGPTSARSESNIFKKANSPTSCVRYKQSQKQSMTKRETIKKIKKKPPVVNPEDKNTDKTFDILVKEVKTKCQCETKFSIERTNLQEGMYKIGTKNIFVRMFRDNIMLRVGGGWETLNEYMNKVDPCCRSGNGQEQCSQKRQSIGNNFSYNKSSTPESLIKPNLRKMSESELIHVKNRFKVFNHSPTTCK